MLSQENLREQVLLVIDPLPTGILWEAVRSMGSAADAVQLPGI